MSDIQRCVRVSNTHGRCKVCKAEQSNETEHYVFHHSDRDNFGMRCAPCTAAYVLANGSEQ